MKNTADKPLGLDDYLKLNYPVTLYPETEGGFTAAMLDLPGCMTQAETVEEAYALIEDAKAGWLAAALESGAEVPLPAGAPVYSGKFVLRVPKSLHRQLAEAAKREGTSLNSYVTAALAQRVAL